MKTYTIGFGDSYPHYYKLKGNSQSVTDGVETGLGKVEGAYDNEFPLQVGDILIINGVDHRIDGFIETREPKGKHNKPATWFRANTTYMRNVN